VDCDPNVSCERGRDRHDDAHYVRSQFVSDTVDLVAKMPKNMTRH
jgi:hypothetical protein